MMKSAIAALLSGFLTAAASPAPAAHAPPKQQLEQPSALSPAQVAAIDAAVTEFIRKEVVPGAVVGVSKKGRISFLKGYGLADVENAAPATPDTVFYTGSMGKQFTAASLLLLAERGKLSIDDPLSKYLPDFPRAKEVTLSQMMSHTSGIADYFRDGFIGGNPSRIERSREELVRYILDTDKLYLFEPGTGWDYSNSNYVLLGLVIEKAAGESYEAFLKKNILDPLGLRNTAMNDLTEIVPHRAQGYRKGKAPNAFKNAEAMSISNMWTAGGLRSTAADLLRWEDALLDGRLLSAKSVSLMMTPARLKDGSVADKMADGSGRKLPFLYGLGAVASEPVAGRRAMGNGGFMPGFNTWVRRLPDDGITIVVLVNMTGYARDIAEKVVPAILGAPQAKVAKAD